MVMEGWGGMNSWGGLESWRGRANVSVSARLVLARVCWRKNNSNNNHNVGNDESNTTDNNNDNVHTASNTTIVQPFLFYRWCLATVGFAGGQV